MSHADTLTRAWSTVEIKSVNEAQRVIEGVASTPSPDLMSDIVEPRGARYRLPLPLLQAHRHDLPIGHVTAARVGPDGIRFTAKFAQIDEPGPLRDRLTTAWQEVASGLVRGVSIGFVPIEREAIPGGGTRYKTWNWIELSTVVVGANADASITGIKSIDAQLLAALDRRPRPERQAQPLTALAALKAKRAQVWTQIDAAKAGGEDWGHLAEIDRGLEAEIGVEKIRASNKSLGIDPDYGLTRSPDLARALQSQFDTLEAQAVQRVNAAIADMERRFEAVQAGQGQAVGKALREVLDREIPRDVLRYGGVYQPVHDYAKGTMITHAGGAWIALRAVEPGERPGVADGWQLAVKSGRDGKDAAR